MTLPPLPIDADKTVADDYQRDLRSASLEFAAACPGTDGAMAITTLVDLNYGPNKQSFVAHCLRYYWPGNPSATALSDAWSSLSEWLKEEREREKAANPRAALMDAIEALSWRVLHCRWYSDSTEYAMWQVAILGQPQAVFDGPLAKLNGMWLNGDPDSPEAKVLVAEVRRWHAVTGGWWWWPDDAEDAVFLTRVQWEQVYAFTLHDPDRGLSVTTIREGCTRKVYRGRDGIEDWLEDNPEVVKGLGGRRRKE